MITKILIVGIGGVGGYFGGLLAKQYKENPEIEIFFLARGEHLKKIQNDGLTIISETDTFIVHPTLATDDISTIGKMNFVILASKSYDLDSTIEQIKPALATDTIVLPLLNGEDISARIRNLMPETEVWDGCVYIVGRLNKPGVVESSGGVHELYFGSENGSNERLQWLERTMIAAGIKAHLEPNIRMIIWRKFIFISVTATLTTYFNVGFRGLLSDEIRKETTISCFKEVLNVASSEGIDFEPDFIENTIQRIERLPVETTSSMHSDFTGGRKVEIETLTEVVLKLANKKGIETPLYNNIYQSLIEKLK